MIQMKEAMMAITQQQSAPPILTQPVLPPPTVWEQPPAMQHYIAPPVKQIPADTWVDGFGATLHVCMHCKKMCTYAADDCFSLENNKGKHDELIKKRKAKDLKKGNYPGGNRGKATGKNKMNWGHGR